MDLFIWVLTIIISSIAWLLYIYRKRNKSDEEWKISGEIKVVIVCQKCRKVWKRPHNSNHVIGQKMPMPCSCGGERYVERIFFEPDKKPKNKLEKYEIMFR